MNPLPRKEMIDQWTPAQLLAVYDFCQLMSHTLWNHYQGELIEQLLEDERGGEIDHCHGNPFDLDPGIRDNPPF